MEPSPHLLLNLMYLQQYPMLQFRLLLLLHIFYQTFLLIFFQISLYSPSDDIHPESIQSLRYLFSLPSNKGLFTKSHIKILFYHYLQGKGLVLPIIFRFSITSNTYPPLINNITSPPFKILDSKYFLLSSKKLTFNFPSLINRTSWV